MVLYVKAFILFIVQIILILKHVMISTSKSSICMFFLALTISIMSIPAAIATPPEDPVKCSQEATNTNCTITNTYRTFPDRSICRAAEAFFPRSESELVSTVARATMARRKMKVATRYSHSIPKLVCPDGQDGILISTKYLNRILSVDVSGLTITVESGVTLRQLIEEAAKWKLALPYSPYWWGLTVGGLMATGSHGSSLWGLGSQVHDHVIRVRIVTPAEPGEGYAKVRLLENGNPELDAVKVSLGVLGVISEVTFRLQPLFKRSVSYITRSDSDLGDQSVTFGRQHEFADMSWYPSQAQVVYRQDDRVLPNASGNGVYDFLGFRSISTLAVATLRTTEEIQERLRDVHGKCTSGKLTTWTSKTLGHGLTNNGVLFTGYPVVGDQNHIQSSGSCLDSPEDSRLTVCPWDPNVKGIFFYQSGISIALTTAKDFIEDVRKLVALDPKSLCGLDIYNGILMRYLTSSSAYLGKQEDSVDFDMIYYRSKDPLAPRLYEDVIEEIEQMAVFKYKGLPHWGKNRNVAFLGVMSKLNKGEEFLKVKQMYDPLGLFSSEWTDQVLGLKDGLSIFKDGCALEGLCICSNDRHCAPANGYYCRPGRVYEDARVCAFGR